MAFRDVGASCWSMNNQPDDGPALAWLLAASPIAEHRDGQQAAATKACELSGWSELGNLEILAAAYAEAGNLLEAVKWQVKAVALSFKAHKAEFEARLSAQQVEGHEKKRGRKTSDQKTGGGNTHPVNGYC